MRTVTAASVVANDESVEGLPPTVIEALGELAGAAKEGLLALSVGVGLGVLHELMEAEVDEVVASGFEHQPRYERLVSEGPGRFFLVARSTTGESVRFQLGRFHVEFADDWLPPQAGTDRGRSERVGSRLRGVLARLHNPGGHPCACLPDCWCRRSRLGYVLRWYVPARWHRLPAPPGPKPDPGGG